jgi:hypothetical protein
MAGYIFSRIGRLETLKGMLKITANLQIVEEKEEVDGED